MGGVAVEITVKQFSGQGLALKTGMVTLNIPSFFKVLYVGLTQH